jgi:signal transduction histidine kinase/HAMP domain-containing protein
MPKVLEVSPSGRLARALRRITGVSVHTKILGMVAGVVLLLGLAVTLLVRARLQAELGASLEERGMAIARDLAARSTDLILTDNKFALAQLIRDTLENNPDVRYVFVLDPNGVVLVHSFGQSVPPDLLAVNQVDGKDTNRVQVLDSEEGLITDVAAPILAGRAGVARVGLSQHRLVDSVSAATWGLIGVTAAVLVVGLGLALVLTRVLTRPVIELVGVARAVGRGDLSAKARHYMDDEVGELASAFNTMTDGLVRSQADLLRRVRELGTLNATATAISGGQSLSEILQAALDKVLEVMNLRAGWIFLVDGEAEPPLRLVVQSGLSVAFAAEETERELGRCVCAHVLQHGQPLLVRDIRRECPRLSPEVIAAEGLRCHASVPLIARDRVVGVMNVASAEARQFTPEEMALLDSVGRQIGVAVENARLWEEVKRKEALRGQLLSQVITAQEAERKRIARELHDEAGQLLTTLLVGLRTLEQIPTLPEAARPSVTQLKELGKHIFDEIHRLAVELRPNVLDQLGLVGALESYARDFGERAGMETDFEASGLNSLHLPGEVEITIYRVVQEAFTNVVKHAAASHVGVVLERRAGMLVAVIEDDGRGFDVELAFNSALADRPHLGLFGMQERVALLGGRLTIESGCEQGTTVFVEIPISNDQDSHPTG